MSAELVLAVDCSTTACKAIAWDGSGKAQAEGRADIALDHPEQDGWEQDAAQWWQAWQDAVWQVTSALGERRASTIAALCNTHQRETFVLTDEDGAPLHPALVWMDARCTDQVKLAEQRFGAKRLHELSGKPPCTTPSLYKLMYLLEQRPDLTLYRSKVLDVHAFLAWRATGRCATSLASADPMGLLDMKSRRWSADLLELAGIEETQLPELVAPGAELGGLLPSVATACGLPAELPVIAGAGDGQAAGLGAGIMATGRAYLNLGTAVVMGVHSDRYRCDEAFRTLYGAQPEAFFLESDLKGGTFTVAWFIDRWLRRSHGAARSFDEVLGDLQRSASELAAGSDGLMLVPYWNGVMNPYWDDDATGIVVGWSGHHGPAHLFRAILEGIAFETRLHIEGIGRAAGAIGELVVMGGGSKSDLWCQILADVTALPVTRTGGHEATALGAGLLAAVAAGIHDSLEAAVEAMTTTGQRFEPGADQQHYDRLYRDVYVDLYPSLRAKLTRLAELRR